MANLSQKQLGILTGMDEFSASARMNQYAKGKHLPDLDTAKRLADALNLPMAYFYCPEEDVAEFLRLLKRLSRQQQKALLKQVRQVAAGKDDG